MRRQRWWLPLVAFVFIASGKLASTLPVPDEELDTSTQLLGSSVVTSVSIVTGSPDTHDVDTKTNTADRKRVIPARDLPASPADLMRPDKFQFFTLNKQGDVVTKQMTEKEIQSLIAAGGGHLPMEIHEPQKVGEIPTGGMKVADVVQNVQNVLKSELNKPATVMTSVPTIPGHANTEWSSILPAILGGESETAPVSEQGPPMSDTINEAQITFDATPITVSDSTGIDAITTKIPAKKPESSSTENYDNTKRPIENLETEVHTEKPMIPVPVITVDQKLPSHQSEEETKPVFQMLNTISADKLNVQNKTHTDEKAGPASADHKDEPVKSDAPAKPENVSGKPSITGEAMMEQAAAIDEKVPEMIEINYPSGNVEPLIVSHVKKPLNTESPIITSEIISKLPESESPSTMTVISETHSTSIKIPGHDEIPLRKPIISMNQQAAGIQIFTGVKKPEASTEKSTSTSITESESDLTTHKSEIATEDPIKITTENSLLSQGTSFFDNLPQAVSSIVTNLISSNSSSSTPIVGDADETVPSTPTVSSDESSTRPATQAVTEKTIIIQKPVFNEEPVYQKMPQIVPDHKAPIHGTSPSEASSIEHIIETLNDPTGIISSPVGADQYNIQNIPQGESKLPATNINHTGSPETTNIPEIHTTSATPIDIETLAEPNSVKPMEALPTELADSLTSMISQISDARPSVLPLGQNAGLDTTEKKNVASMNAEEPGDVDNVSAVATQEDSKVHQPSEIQGELLIQAESETPAVGPEKIAEVNQEAISTTSSNETKLTEPLEETNSTERRNAIPITAKTPSLEIATPMENVTETESIEAKEKPVNRISEQISDNVEVTMGEKSKPGTDKVNDSDNIANNKTEGETVAGESDKIESSSKVITTDSTLIEQSSTNASPTTEVNYAETSASTPSTVHTKKENNVPSNSSTTVQETIQSQNPKTEKPIKIQLIKNGTELPIVRLDIMEAVPTKFHKANESKLNESTDNDEESPLVRIKLTDPVTLVNSMIESSNIDAQSPLVEPLNLPETGSVPPNTLASGLIAGFPSTTNSPTTIQEQISDAHSTSDDPVKSLPEVLIPSAAPAVNATGDQTSTSAETSGIQSENLKKPLSQSPEEINVVTEKTEIDTSTTKTVADVAHEISTEKSTIQKNPSIADSLSLPVKATVDSALEIAKEDPLTAPVITKVTPTQSTETKVTNTLASTTATPENLNTSTKLVEEISVTQDPVDITKTPVIDKAPENRIQITEPLISPLSGSDEKLTSSTNVSRISPATSDKTDANTKHSESSGIINESQMAASELTNLTKSEVHNIATEVITEKIPSTLLSISLPTFETTTATMGPLNGEHAPSAGTAENPQTEAPTHNPFKPSEIESGTSPISGTMATTTNALENTTTAASENQSKLEDEVKKTDKVKPLMEVAPSEKLPELPSTTSTPQQTEEIRIQVNNTAVLVTKRPVPDVPSQKLNEVTKSPNDQPIDEPTTPKVQPASLDSHEKLGEKISLPVPVPVSGLASNGNNGLDTSIQHGAPGADTETRIRLGDEQTEKIKSDKISEKIEDTRKPIKKTSDSDALPAVEQYVIVNSTNSHSLSETSTLSSEISEKTTALQQTESTSQLPTNVEITMNMPSDETPNAAHINESNQAQEKPLGSHENQTPSKLSPQTPVPKPEKPAHKPIMNIKKDDSLPKPTDDQWTLIPQKVHPVQIKTEVVNSKRPITTEVPLTTNTQGFVKDSSTERPPVSLDHPQSASGLDSTIQNLETDVSYFVNLCNELAFTFWTATNKGLSTARSLAVSPFGMTSMLAMVFLGARGPTSDQMNDILKLDDVASFNPHLVFQNVTDAVGLARNQGIANAAFVRVLFADRSKVRKLMPFYKEQAQQFYDGIVAEVNFATISDLVRRRTNLMIRKQTGGRIKDFVRTNTVPLRSPLAALSANVFQTDCNSSAASSEGRDGELYFAVSPAVRQRKLVPVPATVWRAGVLAGYEPGLDATAIALGGTDKLVSTIFVIPGQQGLTAPGDTLDRLEQRLVRGATHDGSWNKLLKVLIPRPGLELQVPKFSHRSVINATAALKRMGLEELFSKHADLKGINGVATDLHLADVLQMNLFSTCGDENIVSGRHHVEVYPGSPLRNARSNSISENRFDESESEPESSTDNDSRGFALPYALHRQTRSARQNDSTEKQRLKLDRPFLYFVRHNPTGLILHMGRFNPRLLP